MGGDGESRVGVQGRELSGDVGDVGDGVDGDEDVGDFELVGVPEEHPSCEGKHHQQGEGEVEECNVLPMQKFPRV